MYYKKKLIKEKTTEMWYPVGESMQLAANKEESFKLVTKWLGRKNSEAVGEKERTRSWNVRWCKDFEEWEK